MFDGWDRDVEFPFHVGFASGVICDAPSTDFDILAFA